MSRSLSITSRPLTKVDTRGRRYILRIKEEQTTVTDDKAMAPPAAQGGSCSCVEGKRAPAATGMQMML